MKPNTMCFKSCKSPSESPALSARRSVLRRIRRQELRKLRALVPPSPGSTLPRSLNQPTDIIYDAIRYIDQLHNTVLARIRAGTLSPERAQNHGVNLDFIRCMQQPIVSDVTNSPSNESLSSTANLQNSSLSSKDQRKPRKIQKFKI